MDDGVTSVDSEIEAQRLVLHTKETLQKGGLTLHTVVSNSRAIMTAENGGETLRSLVLEKRAVGLHKALGIKWKLEADTLLIDLPAPGDNVTRRVMLSTGMSVFDPLELLARTVLKGKVVLQKACAMKLNWDEPVPEAVADEWKQWVHGLGGLATITYPGTSQV